MQNVTLQRASASCISSLLITSTFVAIPPSPACAATLDDLREFMTASHWNSFGVGCAVGAVTGGLLVGLVTRRKNKRTVQVPNDASVDEPADVADSSLRDTGVVPTIDPDEVRSPDQVDTSAPRDEVHSPAVTSEVTKQKPTQENVAEEVQAGKEEQLSAQVAPPKEWSDGLPTISKGEVREDKSPTFNPSPYLAKRWQESARAVNPEARAAIINSRLPRFDESLYPDTTDMMGHDVDMFEAAMRAMEDSLMHPDTYLVQEPAFASDYVSGIAPNGFDASAHVDNIMQEEVERSRSHRARRFSHVHLTVYDGTGTGDLDSTLPHRKYRPRHMRMASREA